MTIYPDASFLVSWLYKPDPLNPKARIWFASHQADDFGFGGAEPQPFQGCAGFGIVYPG